MTEKCTIRFAITAGFLLIISAIASGMWQPPAGQVKTATFIANYLFIHWVENIVYIITSLFSSLLIIPVIISVSLFLYKKRPNGTIVAGSVFICGTLLHIIADLESLSRWVHAIPLSMAKDKTGIVLFETLNTQYVALYFPSLFLLYIAAFIWAISLWSIHRMLSAWLFISILLVVAGIPSLFISPGSFQLFSSASIIAYAMAYIYFGTLHIKLSPQE